jgi:uncharacterized protein
MIIDIDKLPKDGLELCRNFDYPSLDLIEEEAVFLHPVHAEVSIKRVGDEVWVKGRIKTVLSFVCGRCLTPYEFPVDSNFDLVFLPEEMHELKEEFDDEDVDRLFYQSRRIDIREVILEQLNLTFPVRPLCSPSCEGLCAVCGRIRREGNCGCQLKESDLRLEPLKILKKDKRK